MWTAILAAIAAIRKPKTTHLGYKFEEAPPYLDFRVRERDDGAWVASAPKHDLVLFDGIGSSMEEAIGRMIVANRETLRIQFTLRTKDGELRHSTIYGQRRTREQLGPSEVAFFQEEQ